LESDALLTTLNPLTENVLQIVCRKLQEESRTGSFDLLITLKFLASEQFFVAGKAQKSHEARSGLYGGCSNVFPQISVRASIATLAICGLP
jgi:hypothetical protein